MSDDEEFLLDPSDPETQFIPQEDDDETLWEVIEITAEKGKKYKVRWKGIDPKTQKPWLQSWVEKHDCTDDLVRDWKLKQAKKKALKRESGSSKKYRASVGSKTSRVTASLSKLDSAESTRRSTSTTTARRSGSKARSTSPSVYKKSTRSRELTEIHSPPISHHSPSHVSPTHTSASLGFGSSTIGTKRKHSEAISTTTSARILANSTLPTAGAEGDPRTKSVSGPVPPPRKKRKLAAKLITNYGHSATSPEIDDKVRKRKSLSQVTANDDNNLEMESDDVVELDPEHSEPQRRSPSQLEAEEQEEEEERIIEESLSDFHSPHTSPPLEPNYNQGDEGTPIPPVRVYRPQDTAEEHIPTVSQFQHERMDSLPADLAGTTTKLEPPAKNNMRRATPSSSSTAAINSTVSTTTKCSTLNQVAETTPLNGEEDMEILSASVKKRLSKFDKAMMKIELRKEKAKEQQPDNGATPGKVKKGKERRKEDKRDGGMAAAGGSGRQEHGSVRTSEEKRWKGKEKEQIDEDKEQGAITPQPPGTERKKKPESLFLPDESDSEDNPSHPPVPSATPFVDRRCTLKSRMKPKTPQPKSRPLSRTSSAVGALALGVKLDMDVDISKDIDEGLEELDDVSGAVKRTSAQKANENNPTTTKPLQPIRRLSPSVFKDYFPSSSLPESIIESTETNGDDAAKRTTDRNEDDSIEQFESPVKKTIGGERRVGVLNVTGRQGMEKQRAKESASDVWDSDLNRRGQDLAEAARKREKERLRAEGDSAFFASTLTKSMPGAKIAPLVTGGLDHLSDLLEEEINPDVSMQSLPPDVILPLKDTIVQQMEDAYVDLSGGVREDQITSGATVGASASASTGIEGSQSIEAELTVDFNDINNDAEKNAGIAEQQLDSIHLREEEEESTQDIMMELLLHQQRQGVRVGQGGNLVSETRDQTTDLVAIQIDSQPIGDSMLDEGAQTRDTDRSVDEIPSILVEKTSRASSTRPDSSPKDRDEPSRRRVKPRTPKSRSRSHSFSSHKNEKDLDLEAEVPATASTRREALQASSQPAGSQTEDQENPHHLGAAMHLLNAKSEEISKLEVQLSAEQRKNEDLLQQISALRLQLTKSTDDASSNTKTLEQEIAEIRSQLSLQTTSWEKERAALVLGIETATQGKVSAEQDRDFFREQYAKASAFVSSVRDENTELEKRMKIAADQAQSGVNLIKTTFELRTKSLEDDIRAWRRMAEFLIEKDRRTNDDIRRRAAEEPELRARCDRQEGVLEETSERLVQVEMDLKENQRLFVEAAEAGKGWKEATVKLNLELNEAKTKLERIGKVGIDDDDKSAHPNGHEFVYRCQWRPDNSNDACEAVFLNISELEEHLYTGGHLT